GEIVVGVAVAEPLRLDGQAGQLPRASLLVEHGGEEQRRLAAAHVLYHHRIPARGEIGDYKSRPLRRVEDAAIELGARNGSIARACSVQQEHRADGGLPALQAGLVLSDRGFHAAEVGRQTGYRIRAERGNIARCRGLEELACSLLERRFRRGG